MRDGEEMERRLMRGVLGEGSRPLNGFLSRGWDWWLIISL
jgi:hypothetical protein